MAVMDEDPGDDVQSMLRSGKPILFSCLTQVLEAQDARYQTLRDFTTEHPENPDASIQTLLQIDQQSSRGRIVVRSGPDSTNVVHATFEVDAKLISAMGPSALTWARFSGHATLCVLTNSTTLTIFDVYPGSDLLIGPEGLSVSLPFECRGIFGLGTVNGILLQRIDDVDDRHVVDSLEEDGFFLRSPPSVNRIETAVGKVIPGPDGIELPQPVSSLFSLTNPLEEVLPVSLLSKSSDPAPVTDAFEKILWIGATRDEVGKIDKTLVITHHALYRRHAVYTVEDAPTPQERTPLYVQSRGWRRGETVFSSLDLMIPSDDNYANHRDVLSRDDALADALGIRKSPHSAMSRPRSRDSEPPSSIVGHMSFLSSAGGNESGPCEITDASLFGSLEPKLAIRQVYREPNESSGSPADSVFLATDSSGKSLSTICMMFQGTSTLRMWSVCGDSVVPLSSLLCRGALPLEAITNQVFICADLSDSLLLYRSNSPVCLCSTPPAIVGATISAPFKDRVTVGDSVRASLSLEVNDVVVHQILLLWDAALPSDIALALRVELIRLRQEHSCTPWEALQATWQFLFGAGFIPENENTESGQYDAMLRSELHRSFCQQGSNGDFFHDFEPWKTGPAVIPGGVYRVLKSGAPKSLLRLSQSGDVLRTIFDSTFLLYEDFKLSSDSYSSSAMSIAELLIHACWTRKSLSSKFIHYLAADLGINIATVASASDQSGNFSTFQEPPSIFSWLAGMLDGSTVEPFCPGILFRIAPVCKRLSTVVITYKELCALLPGRGLRIVQVLLEAGYTDRASVQEALSLSIAIPLLDILQQCRSHPTPTKELQEWSPEAWAFVGRIDLSRNAEDRQFRAPRISGPGTSNGSGIDGSDSTDDPDGLKQVEVDSSLLFRNDNRVREVSRLLKSSAPVLLQVPRPVEVSDHDYEKLKQTKLLLLARKTLALCIGRGMLTIGGLRPVPAEPLPTAELCLKGRLPPSYATIALDISECPADLTVWPEFHNGVAAGLRLPLVDGSTGGTTSMSRTWILYNRPPPASNAEDNAAETAANEAITHRHGGVLFGLGLRGHLTSLETSDIYDYLTKGTVTTTVGIMLGLAANRRGSCDMSVSKMLCLHIPSLIPQHFSAIDVASPVQSAAAIGIGLLYQRSSHRMMTEFLLNEIGRRPDSDVTAFDREAYTLACGLALGMVNLSLGGEAEDVARAAGIADLHCEERLYKFVSGGVDTDEVRRMRETNDRFSIPSANGNGDNEKCCVTYESDMVNTEVSSPGAILALGLMYMKSGNHAIASALEVPSTHFLLEFVRPDFLTLRVFTKALILWDDVEPTKQWIDRQVPPVVVKAYEEIKATATQFSAGQSPSKQQKAPAYDRRAVRQIYAHVVAGGCFSLGLRYAGSGNILAKNTILEFIREFKDLRDAATPTALACRPELPVLETCLCLMAVSFALVLAGTGDLDALCLLRVLQWRCDDTVSYGNHTTYGMAIGLLFLGGGSCTVGREPEDIAALVAAFFPRFASSTSDNQSHLQAIRHLYALAVKKRDVVAVDIDSGAIVHVQAKVEPYGETFTTPFLLRSYDRPVEFLDISSDDFFHLRVNMDKIGSHAGRIFYVKKKSTVADDDPEDSTVDSVVLRRIKQHLGHSNSVTNSVFGYVCNQVANTGNPDSVPVCAPISNPESLLSPGSWLRQEQELNILRKYLQSSIRDDRTSLIQADLMGLIIESSDQELACQVTS